MIALICQEETRKAQQKIEQLQLRLEDIDLDDGSDEDDGGEGLQLTREQMEQILGNSPLHTELRKHLDKVLSQGFHLKSVDVY